MNAEKTGAFIRDLRKERNLKQQQLAELLCVSDKAISRWETGKGFPDLGNLEGLARVLDVSVAELLKGERFPEKVDTAFAETVAADSLSMAKREIGRRGWLNRLAGFVVGCIVLTLLAVHFTSPIAIREPENALSLLDVLSGEELVAVLKDDVASYDIQTIVEPESQRRYTFVSCSDNRWHQLTGGSNRTIVDLGPVEAVDYVFYYPSKGSDRLIYTREGLREPDGVVTLPRLIYNYWVLAGAALSVVGIVVWLVLRKGRFADAVLKGVMAPVALTISMLALTAGAGPIYDAPYYLSGILLLALLLYALFLIILGGVRRRRAENAG